MTAHDLVAELQARGVALTAAGDRIRFRPASAVPPELLDRLRTLKSAVLALLTTGTVSDDKTVGRAEARDHEGRQEEEPAISPGVGPDLAAEVHRRTLIFRHQIEQAAGGVLPLLILPGIVAGPGKCISCSKGLPEGRCHRCDICLAAVYLALDQPALAVTVLGPAWGWLHQAPEG